MKLLPSLTLVLSLMSTPGTNAQEGIESTARLLDRVTTLRPDLDEAAALHDAGGQTGASSNADWVSVRLLKPGTPITVTTNDSQRGKRYILSADESGLTVLNLADTNLPAAARKVLQDLALHSPALFRDAGAGRLVQLNLNVRLAPEGLFVTDRKIADLGQIINRIARIDVAVLFDPNEYQSLKRNLGHVVVEQGVRALPRCGHDGSAR